jgi:hypothetical protein
MLPSAFAPLRLPAQMQIPGRKCLVGHDNPGSDGRLTNPSENRRSCQSWHNGRYYTVLLYANIINAPLADKNLTTAPSSPKLT